MSSLRSHLTRRKIVELLSESGERLELLTAVVTGVLLVSNVLELLWEEMGKVSLAIERPLKIFHIVSLAVLLALPLARRVIYRRLRLLVDTAGLDERSWAKRKRRLLALSTEGHEVSCTRFATEKDMDMLATINREAFAGTAFEVDEEALRERNSAYLRQNSQVFLLHLDPSGSGEVMGYSCLLPLRLRGDRLYRRGLLADEDLPAELLTLSGDELPASVLLFAIAIRTEWQPKGAHWRMRNEIHLFRSLRHHYDVLYRAYQKQNADPPLLVQTAEYGLTKRLIDLGLVRTGERTRDGYALWELSDPSAVLPLKNGGETSAAEAAGATTCE